MRITQSFKGKPFFFYAMSIAATWANAGSLLNGVATAQNSGVVPFALWALGNTLACVVFGLAAPRIPKLREVFRSKIMRAVMGVMCPFQCWISMNGMQTVFAGTALGSKVGVGVALACALFFIALLLRYGMIRNVLTDHMSWIIVYVLVFAVASIALWTGDWIRLPVGTDAVGTGIKNCILLIPGAFLYPYYYEILDYNDANEDGTAKIDAPKAFMVGCVVFGAYLVGIFAMSKASFSPALNIVKAVLVTLIAASSLSSFLYSIYLTFGRRLGLALNIATVCAWRFLIPLGVMGAWTLMASIRIYIVAGAIAAALIWHAADRRKAVTA